MGHAGRDAGPLVGYGPDPEKNVGEAKAIMQKLGYSEAKPLKIKIQTRNLPTYRDPAVIVFDQLKKIYIVGELDILDTPRWYAKLARKDYTIGSTSSASVSTIPTATSSRTTPATPSATTPNIATPSRKAARRPVPRTRQGEAQEARLGHRAHPGRGRARPVIAGGASLNCWQPYVKNLCRTTTASTTICDSRTSGRINS